jgi:MFS family permease
MGFIQILFIPIFGKYLNKLKAHRLFLGGVFVCGAANIVFGFLQWVNEMQTFLALSFVIRIVSAIGEAAFLTSLYPLATKVSIQVVNKAGLLYIKVPRAVTFLIF